MSHADDVFIKIFLGILGALVAFAIVAYIAGTMIAGKVEEQQASAESAVKARIGPIAQVRSLKPGETPPAPEPMAAPEAPAAAQPVAQAEAKSGETVYNGGCMACHGTGVPGAPQLGDAAAWTARLEQGMDALVGNAINGKNAMPAKGGNPAWSDDEVRGAVEYMLMKAGLSAN